MTLLQIMFLNNITNCSVELYEVGLWVRSSQIPAIAHRQPKACNNARRTDHTHVRTHTHTHTRAQGSVCFLFGSTDPFENLKFSRGKKKICTQNIHNYKTFQVIHKAQMRSTALKALLAALPPAPRNPEVPWNSPKQDSCHQQSKMKLR